jgi:hypothetical protein
MYDYSGVNLSHRRESSQGSHPFSHTISKVVASYSQLFAPYSHARTVGLVQPWVGQNVTFCSVTATYIPHLVQRNPRDLVSCSPARGDHICPLGCLTGRRKVILSRSGRRQVRFGRIRHYGGHWEKPRTADFRNIELSTRCSDRCAV